MFCKTGILSPFTEILEDHHQLLWGGCVVVCRQVIKPEVDNFGFQIKQSLNCSTCNRVVRKLRRTHQTTQYPHGPWREPQGSGDMIMKDGGECLCEIPCPHTSPGALSKREQRHQAGCLPGLPGLVRWIPGWRRALDQRPGPSCLPSGRSREFRTPGQDFAFLCLFLWYNRTNHGYEGDLRIGRETVLSRLPGRPSSAWVSAPPGV